MTNLYQSPFSLRYASEVMQKIFSEDAQYKIWRELWIALAKAEKELGINISNEQIRELEKFKNDINYDIAIEKEKELKHDVMAHIYAYGEQCPTARPIIHLGATSCYIKDNAELIIARRALDLIRVKLINVVKNLSEFALEYKDLPTLGFTHLQPAQPVTVGKRACMWIQDLLMDLEDINYILDKMQFLGSKGTTGTQASFLYLFGGDSNKVKRLEELIAKEMGFDKIYPISGQTYTRKFDSSVLNILSGVAQSAHKFANDIRLLQSMKEIEEPFSDNQVGSSAMPYKRNPMRTERMCSLARLVMVNALNSPITVSNQWLERTLDDSANRRIAISEMFLATDAILNIYMNVSNGLVVYPEMIKKHLQEELPFMATENILMEAVKRGGDRQELHSKIRDYAMQTGLNVKNGGNNDLVEKIASDKSFNLKMSEIEEILSPSNFIGRSIEQVEEFISEYVTKIITDKEPKDVDMDIRF